MGETLNNLTVDAIRELVRHTVDDTTRRMIGDKISTAFDTDESHQVQSRVIQSMRKFLPDTADEDQNACSE